MEENAFKRSVEAACIVPAQARTQVNSIKLKKRKK
jgi:hypothetical protein